MDFWVTLPGKPPRACQGGSWGWGNFQWRKERVVAMRLAAAIRAVLFFQVNSLRLCLRRKAPWAWVEKICSTRNGLCWPWGCTAHVSLQEANSLHTLAAVPFMLPPGCFQHMNEHHWGFWSQANPTSRHRTPLANNLCPKTPHQSGQDFLRTVHLWSEALPTRFFVPYFTVWRLFLSPLSFPGTSTPWL